MKTVVKLLIIIFILGSCTPVTYNPGNYYGKKKVVVKEKYTSADAKKKKKYYTDAEYRKKQLAKKTNN
jgi:hypothetical protein